MPDKDLLSIDLSTFLIDEHLIQEISGNIVTQFEFMPVFKIGNTVTIALSDPDNLPLIDSIQEQIGYSVETVLAKKEDIKVAIRRYYGFMGSIDALVSEEETDFDVTTKEKLENAVLDDKIEDEGPIIELVNLLINQAIISHASDIHIEPSEKEVLVRTRVDGTLHKLRTFPKKYLPPIVSRIKVMANMDIAESRLPQDGNIRVSHENVFYELRVSSLPTIHGENIVIRILGRQEVLLEMKELGFLGKDLENCYRLIGNTQGMILVTGPTGSGKTTTLYAALNHINDVKHNIITLEDPVEYKLPLIRQVQVQNKSGLTFARGLRSILRQDPDIIMVGEIRDLETAELAARASLTGHLVFSTLHTNDAPSTVIRLLDMGIPNYVISSSVTGVFAQRLVRCICKKCIQPYEPDPSILDFLKLPKEDTYYKGSGCKSCFNSGYKGRVGIYEILVMNSNLVNAISNNVTSSQLREIAIENGMTSMLDDGLKKIKMSLTTPEEVFKACQFLAT